MSGGALVGPTVHGLPAYIAYCFRPRAVAALALFTHRHAGSALGMPVERRQAVPPHDP